MVVGGSSKLEFKECTDSYSELIDFKLPIRGYLAYEPRIVASVDNNNGGLMSKDSHGPR